MLARTRDRLEALEAKIAPKAKVFVFISFDAGELGAPSREDRLAAFKAELGIVGSTLRVGGALVRVRKLRSLDWSGKGDAHLVDEVARGAAARSKEVAASAPPRPRPQLRVVAGRPFCL